MSGTTAGWYPDPYDSTQMRWFDGTAWTETTQPLVQAVGIAADAPGAQQAASGSTQVRDTGWQGVNDGQSTGGAGEVAVKSGNKKGLLIGVGAAAGVLLLGGVFMVGRGGSSTGDVVADPAASSSAAASDAAVYTTPDSAEAIASSLLTGAYLDGVLAVQPGSFKDEKVETRTIEGLGYAADGTYKNQKAYGTLDPTDVQLSVSWYGDKTAATDAFRAQSAAEDAVFIEKFKSQFTTKSPYLDGQMMVRTVRNEGEFLVTALCVGPTSTEATLVACAQSSGNAQGRQTAAQFDLNGTQTGGLAPATGDTAAPAASGEAVPAESAAPAQ